MMDGIFRWGGRKTNPFFLRPKGCEGFMVFLTTVLTLRIQTILKKTYTGLATPRAHHKFKSWLAILIPIRSSFAVIITKRGILTCTFLNRSLKCICIPICINLARIRIPIFFRITGTILYGERLYCVVKFKQIVFIVLRSCPDEQFGVNPKKILTLF